MTSCGCGMKGQNWEGAGFDGELRSKDGKWENWQKIVLFTEFFEFILKIPNESGRFSFFCTILYIFNLKVCSMKSFIFKNSLPHKSIFLCV